jgi:hypothetical protein
MNETLGTLRVSGSVILISGYTKMFTSVSGGTAIEGVSVLTSSSGDKIATCLKQVVLN